MSIVLEMEANGRKAGHVCARDYRKGPSCPLIVRQTSEDLLTANTFGILRHLRPTLWLRSLLCQSFQTKRFRTCSMKRLNLSFWHPLPPPSLRANVEGWSEVDLCVRFDETVVLVESKYRAELSRSTKHDEHRDQLIRLLDVGWEFCIGNQFLPRRPPYVLIIAIPDAEPSVVSRYRNPEAVAEALAHHRRFPEFGRMTRLLAERVGYMSWSGLAGILQDAMPRASGLEKILLDNVEKYLRLKIATAHLNNEALRQIALPGVGGVAGAEE